jgi:hypothetical protein
MLDNCLYIYARAGEKFWGYVPKMSINFEEIVSPVCEKLEEQNDFLESSLIIANYCIIIIINAYYNYTITALYNYYTSYKVFLEEFEKEKKKCNSN